ncbi:MAG: glycosyltransferase, partial [Fidelibacterota bacterium]
MINKLLSFVIPAYCEQDNLRPAYQAIQSVMEKRIPDYRWEIIFVDDGSEDKSAEVLDEL